MLDNAHYDEELFTPFTNARLQWRMLLKFFVVFFQGKNVSASTKLQNQPSNTWASQTCHSSLHFFYGIRNPFTEATLQRCS